MTIRELYSVVNKEEATLVIYDHTGNELLAWICPNEELPEDVKALEVENIIATYGNAFYIRTK